MIIREYKPEDKSQIEHLISELQDYQSQFVPNMLKGEQMAAKYLENAVLKVCNEKQGKIFVADQHGRLIGYIWVWIENEPRDLMYKDPIYTFVHVGDYIVLDEYRNQGIGKALLQKVEAFAKEKGIDKLKLEVSAKNKTAQEVYKKQGFEEEEITLEKNLS